MAHIFNPNHLGHLDNPIRRLFAPPKKTLLQLGLRKGDTLIDFGAGSGYFSLPASEIVGDEGMVYAVDIEPLAIALIEEKCQKLQKTNLKTVPSTGPNLNIQAESGSIALLYTVLHEVEEKVDTLSSIFRSLKKAGRIAIIEFSKNAFFGPSPSERIGEDEAISLLTKAGFTNVSISRINSSLYCASAIK